MSVLYPNVPLGIAGVPAVLRRQQTVADAEALASTAATRRADVAQFVWGVYTVGGTLAVEPDNVVAVEMTGEYRIADYPLEAGQLESYNKVATPRSTRVVLTKGGTLAERTTFLERIETIRKSLDLFDVVTPEATYLNMNLERVSVMRSQQSGAGMAIAECVFREVRNTVALAFSTSGTAPPMTPGTVKSPAAARAQNQGSVQPRLTAQSLGLL